MLLAAIIVLRCCLIATAPLPLRYADTIAVFELLAIVLPRRLIFIAADDATAPRYSMAFDY